METRVERMKSQTIGIEIEMAEITRNQAIRIVAKHFGTLSTVRRLNDGYDTWICLDEQRRTWRTMSDSSILASNQLKKCELVTPILKYDDIETLQELIRKLRKAGAISNPAHGCGVHIHIGAEGHTPQTLRNLANLMASHEMLIKQALNIDDERISRYCKTVDRNFLAELNTKKPKTMSQLADIWYGTQGCNYGRTLHYNVSRYHMLNYHATFTKGTVEFRLFQFDNPTEQRKGGLHAGQLKSYIQFCLALNQMAKDLKTASPKEQQKENPKYAMRTWLLRLGFIGDEFKTAREFFTKRLAGDSAFRTARR